MIEKHKVSIFYTAPTAIRSLIKASETNPEVHPRNYNLSSLRLLGSVGEPINPEAWMWYFEQVGGSRCPIADTFWQTETGGHVITPLPGARSRAELKKCWSDSWLTAPARYFRSNNNDKE